MMQAQEEEDNPSLQSSAHHGLMGTPPHIFHLPDSPSSLVKTGTQILSEEELTADSHYLCTRKAALTRHM